MSEGPLEASVTLDEVFAALATKRVPMAPELAGYLVLEIAERVDAKAGEVDPSRIFLGDEGLVVVIKRQGDVLSGDAETSVRGLLARLLLAGGTVTPGLSAAARRPSGAGLVALAGELETALIPVNRAAGRRALGRLAREVRRLKLGLGRNALPPSSDAVARKDERQPSHRPLADGDEDVTRRRRVPEELSKPAVAKPKSDWPDLPTSEFINVDLAPLSATDVDALIEQFGVSGDGDKHHARALGNIVGLEPTPPPTGAGDAQVETQPRDSDVESLLALANEPQSQIVPTVALGPAEAASKRARVEGLSSQTSPQKPRRIHSTGDVAPRADKRAIRSPRTSPFLAIVALAALGGAAYALLRLRPPLQTAPPSQTLTVKDEGGAIVPTLPACNATLIVTGVPQRAEVLLRAGQAPLDVDKMPVGARLEFVATAEGYAPKRVVVPAGAPWDKGPDEKPRFEAAVQLDKSKPKLGAEVWPPGEPGSEVGGQGPPGTVRVVATPRGAEIWLLAGIGPEARVDQLRCDRDVDVLVAGPTTFRKRLHVAASDFVVDTQSHDQTKISTRLARVSVPKD